MDPFRTEPGVYHAVGVVRRVRAPGDEVGESYEHWRRALTVIVGRLGSMRSDNTLASFISIAVPATLADALQVALRRRGDLCVRLGDAPHGETATSRLVHIWRMPTAPAAPLLALPAPVIVEAEIVEAEIVEHE